MPSHLSTAVSTSSGLPLAATTSLFVPVTSASVQPQGARVHFTQEQSAMADALGIPVALRRTGNVLKLQEHYTHYLALLEAEKTFKKMQRMELGLLDLDCLLGETSQTSSLANLLGMIFGPRLFLM